MPSSQRLSRLTRLTHLVAPGVLGALFVWLVAHDWRCTGDALIDFGREPYHAWRIAHGGIIGRDVVTLFGPLPAGFNGLVFRVFGTSLGTMLWTNALLAAVATVLLFVLFSRVFDRQSALFATGAFLVLNAFSDFGPVSNYNFLTPYTHAATHGFVLLVVVLFALERWLATAVIRWMSVAAFALGLTVLVKPEMLLSGALALLLAIAIAERGRRRRALIVALCMGAVPLLVAIGLLARELPLSTALASAFSALISIKAALVAQPFYAHVSGLDEPAANLVRMLSATIATVGAAVLVAWLDLAIARRWPNRARVAVLGAIVLAVPVALLTPQLALDGWSRALPVLVLAIAVDAYRKHDRKRLLLSVAALVMLAKIVLHAWFSFYGFVLTPLALMLVIGTLVHTVPARLKRLGSSRLVRTWACLATAAICFIGARQTGRVLATHTLKLAGGADSWFVSPVRGNLMRTLVNKISHETHPKESVAVVPDGATLDYLLRRVNPTPFTTLMPIEISSYGQRRIVRAFTRRPPDVVVIVAANFAQYGTGPFGTEPASGEALMRWLEQHYRQRDEVLSSNGKFVRARILLRRR